MRVSSPRPVRRWRALSKPQRTELYVRWSLYAVALVQPVVTLGVVAGSFGRDGVTDAESAVAVVGSLAAAALNGVLVRVGMAAYLGRRGRPYAWVAVAGTASAAVSVAELLLGPPVEAEGASFPLTVSILTMTFWIAATAVALSVLETAAAAVAGLLLVALPLLLTGASPGFVAGLLTGCLLGSSIAACTARGSAWTAKVVWELDAAREAQARLAVAEERLRFSRDLHDVLGRNLATIALKSELAVQLARRRRPEAVDQMTEVQRIAQDSQREVREVVRGYRTVELHTELAGAASVLRAANVDCRTELSGAGGLPAEAQSVLGWVVREAATNVLRHSEAANCLFRLRVAGGTAVLEVENDGVPAVPPPRAEGAGSGLRGLGERLAAQGGTLSTAGSGPGRFRLTAELPITARGLAS
ncbi:sensor histidine kinase [Kitasatospora cineracea]|uniref:Two-component system sensor histidine kinase DesK n=1 Tax=Kitasatospora cineracea TaxID=88074 RepID=A0A3N4RJT2_9ACTN|nr:histidine kinase [Kitasatospora cineracea]ROR43289.1 two-component system sensor histidine kinase DesK [Kitasatospora cineracea]RPE33662.1 two-component system sensor histidine kinase DesK [Kitasatospora cineracea]